MNQLWVPGMQPLRLSREFVERCLHTTTGGPTEKAHYLAMALYAATREGSADQGEFVVRSGSLRTSLEHSADGATLRRKLAALEREGLLEISRAGRARRYRVHARPDDRIMLTSSIRQAAATGLQSAIEADQISYALSQARTGHWKPKTLLMALGALWRARGTERGSVRVGWDELATILESERRRPLEQAAKELRNAGYIDWIETGHAIELAFVVDAYGHPNPQWRGRNRIAVHLAPAADAQAPATGAAPGPRVEEPETPAPAAAAPPEPRASVPPMTARQLRTLAGILRGLFGIASGEPVEAIGLAALPEDLAAELNRRAGGLRRAGGGDAQISLETIPADIGAELIRRLGGPARNETERRLRNRWLRERMRRDRRKTPGRGGRKPGAPAGNEEAARGAASQQRAKDSARQLGYVPTDNPDEPWIRLSRAGMLGYDIVGGLAIQRRTRGGGTGD